MIGHKVSMSLLARSRVFHSKNFIYSDYWNIKKDNKVLKRAFKGSNEWPTMTRWLREISSCTAMEKITYILKGKEAKFKKIWSPFSL